MQDARYNLNQLPSAWDLYIDTQSRHASEEAVGHPTETTRLLYQTARRLVDAEQEIARLRSELEAAKREALRLRESRPDPRKASPQQPSNNQETPSAPCLSGNQPLPFGPKC